VTREGEARAVASNRADVFKDGNLSGIEKRALMRFLKAVHGAALRDRAHARRSGKSGEETHVAVGAPGSEWGDGEFQQSGKEEDQGGLDIEPGERMDAFLTRHGLSENVKDVVMYALALQTRADCDALTAVEALKVYILSVAKYGPQTGACLIPVYGSGDIPQAFCRVAAVKGTTYVLRQGVRDIDTTEKTVKALTSTGGQRVQVERVVTEAPENISNALSAHAVCITNASLVPEYGQIFIVFPPRSARDGQRNVIRALQIGSHTGCCPEGKFLLYLSNVVDADETKEDAFANLHAALDMLVIRNDDIASTRSVFGVDDECKPKVLWGITYTQKCVASGADVDCASGNVALCPNADDSCTYDGAMRAAERAYAKIYGDDEEMFPAENAKEQPEDDRGEE